MDRLIEVTNLEILMFGHTPEELAGDDRSTAGIREKNDPGASGLSSEEPTRVAVTQY